MDITDRNVDDFLSTLPVEVRDDMLALDAVISAAMTGLPRELYVGKFWGGSSQEIIGYGRLSYSQADGKDVEWFMVGLAVQKNYLSLYVSAVEDGKYLSERYGKDLGKVKVGKSSISFTSTADIDLDAVGTLVARARTVLE